MTDKEEIAQKKKRRSTAKGKFHRIYRRFQDSLHEAEQINILKELHADLEKSYNELDLCTNDYIELLDEEKDAEKLNDIQNDMDTIYKELYGVKSLLSRKTAEYKSGEEQRQKSQSLKVKKLDTPEFSGQIRDYPSFKRDYERHMVPSFGQDPFALKKCLSGEALKTVKGVDDDFTEMFRRLDLKYGRPEKLSDAVLTEIKRLRVVQDGDFCAFIAMVDVVENCWLDLKKMGLEREMDTSIMVSQIEKLLPGVQKREWALRKQKCESMFCGGVFATFLNFLLEEKYAMEYMKNDMRDTSDKHQRVKAHSTLAEADTSESEDTPKVKPSLQDQLDRQQEVLDQVVKGLAQVAEVVADPRSRGATGTGSSDGTPRKWGPQRAKCWYHGNDTHEIQKCVAFGKLDLRNKIELLRKNGGCFCCLKQGHIASRCLERKPCDIQNCGQLHHPTLHSVNISGTSCHNAATIVNERKADGESDALLMISTVTCKQEILTVLWDPGANMSLITHGAARRLGISGKDIMLSVTKVGNCTESITSKEYVIPLTDLDGRQWTIRAYGMEEVTAEVGTVDVSKVTTLFKGVHQHDLRRPTGAVDLLIGTDCCVLLPEKMQEAAGLQLMKNQFGYCIRGKHELLTTSSGKCNTVRIHFASGLVSHPNQQNLIVSNKQCISKELNRFFEVESLGTECTPKCGGCKCGKCPIGGKEYTIQEERELVLIKKGLEHDPTNKQWTASYPWVKNPAELPNNYAAARARLASTERRLLRVGTDYARMYDNQIKDMAERKVARKLSQEELTQYNGPVHYLPHHEVSKPDSKSTPLRIVFNSSSSFMGHVLNDYWAKGPNIVNDLLAVLLRFRQRPIALLGDISKMYNAVKISTFDQHTHRFLWRDMDTQREPDHYVMQAVTFGDRPSGAIATMALRQTAELQKDAHQEAAKIIMDNSYVDDILHSTENSSEAERIAGEIDNILSDGGFRVKHWTLSGSDDFSNSEGIDLQLEEEKVLGMIWDPKRDIFKYKAKLNFSDKVKKVRKGKNLSVQDIPDQIPECLTHRMVLSQVSILFDPLGLINPVVLHAKMLMRLLCLQNRTPHGTELESQKIQNWDTPMETDMRNKWLDFFVDMFEVENLHFPRCVKPAGAKGDPMLIIFSDGSKLAYGTCAYIRWETKNGQFIAHLIAAKNRIAPTRQMSIPRLELCGAVLGARLREKLVRELDFAFSRIFHIVDSMIVRAQIQKESYGFGTFTATGVAEIQAKSEPNEWWWTPGDQNPADLTTRVSSPIELGDTSLWQSGPRYLRWPIEQWPISQECPLENTNLPDVIVGLGHNVVEANNCMHKNLRFDDIDPNRFKDVNSLLRVTCIISRIAKNKSFSQNATRFCSGEIKESETLWIKYVQNDIRPDWRKAYNRLGVSINQDGIIVVGSRMSEWLKDTWNQSEFVLLPPNGRFTVLCMKSAHNHSGVDATLAKLRSKFWIPGARRFLKLLRKKCVICRKRDRKRHTQVMGALPLERLKPSPPFYYSAVDLFGPINIRDTVKKRSHSKAYDVIFTCLSSRAVYLDLSDNYSTDGFMLVLRRFVSLRGYPRKMRSDIGTQLSAASKEIQALNKNLDWTHIESFGTHSGMDWEFNKSADAPWENGCCEALIKSVKNCLRGAIGDGILSFSELQTALFEVANCINERPIGMKNDDPNEGSYLCPNDLILGRATSRVPVGSWSVKECFKIRWKFVQQLVDAFWKRWTRDYFPTLIIRQKWHTNSRNLRVGDVVLVQDSNAIRGRGN